jgi:hypothetical protein
MLLLVKLSILMDSFQGGFQLGNEEDTTIQSIIVNLASQYQF